MIHGAVELQAILGTVSVSTEPSAQHFFERETEGASLEKTHVSLAVLLAGGLHSRAHTNLQPNTAHTSTTGPFKFFLLLKCALLRCSLIAIDSVCSPFQDGRLARIHFLLIDS